MPAQGTILEDHIPVNNFQLQFAGVAVPLFAISVGEMAEELEMVTLPDRTNASGGNTVPFETDVVTPEHHALEQQAWEQWYREAKLGTPGYKKVGTLLRRSVSGAYEASHELVGAFPRRKTLSELDATNEGEMSTVTWGLSIDSMTKLT